MIDVCGNDGAAARDFGPHKLRCYFVRDIGTKSFLLDVDGETIAGSVDRFEGRDC